MLSVHLQFFSTHAAKYARIHGRRREVWERGDTAFVRAGECPATVWPWWLVWQRADGGEACAIRIATAIARSVRNGSRRGRKPEQVTYYRSHGETQGEAAENAVVYASQRAVVGSADP
ncbi:hypothetical protein NUW54_g2293 [Trametes sanguinea]|uniref:Uncharacterized protein n=1 Tax=Trametes sanguinea TaxID=158606 RepID=A0ACC1Q697_9APHY|nr:hypothetical protein NUW54_g2293 [Trametes sanguinea]